MQQQATQIRNLIRAAKTLGATLPPKTHALAEHSQTIAQQVREFGATDAEVVNTLSADLGDPDAVAKALPKALDALVRTKHAGMLAAQLEAKTNILAWNAIAADVNAVTTAFGEAVQPHIDTLNAHAATVPAWVSAATAEDLQPAQFEAWKACTAAVKVIDQALTAVAPLYGRSNGDTFTVEAARHSVVCEVPETMTYDQAWNWVHALSSRRAQGENNPIGQLRVDNSGAWFAQVAALSGTFRWVTPTERRARLDRLSAATVPPVVERPGTPVSSPLVFL